MSCLGLFSRCRSRSRSWCRRRSWFVGSMRDRCFNCLPLVDNFFHVAHEVQYAIGRKAAEHFSHCVENNAKNGEGANDHNASCETCLLIYLLTELRQTCFERATVNHNCLTILFTEFTSDGRDYIPLICFLRQIRHQKSESLIVFRAFNTSFSSPAKTERKSIINFSFWMMPITGGSLLRK